MQNVFVVTHTESEHHVNHRVGGWFDSDLTKLGEKQAEAIAARLASLVPDRNLRIVSSDLKRAARTADIIGGALGATPALDPRLRENSYGDADGKPQHWLDERIVAAPEHDRLDHIVVSGAESKRTFIQRIYDAVSELETTSDIIIVTHGYALTFVISCWIGLRLEDAGYVNFKAAPGGITHLVKDDFFRNKAVQFLNDTSHLVDI